MNDFFDAFSKVPLSQKLLLLLLVMAAIFIGFYMFFFNAVEQQITEQQSAQRELRTQQSRRQQLEGEKTRLEEQLRQEARLRENLSFDQLLPPRPELPALIDQIESLVEDVEPSPRGTNLEILHVRPRPHVRAANFTRIPLELRLIGTFDQLLDFSWQLVRMDRIVHITAVSASVRSSGGPTAPPLLRISLEVEAFYRAQG
jgi:Tfp pilus assembly protein PilO